MPSRKFDDLDLRFKPLAIELVARCSEILIPVMIITTRRTSEEQRTLYSQGRTTPGKIVTWTLVSAHTKGLAIDICPYSQYQLHGPDKLQWDADDPAFIKIGEIGQGLGLKWGVIMAPDYKRKDLGHFEFKEV